ncbi:hypothetical protein L1987_65184 [Smallanthus sonchifolius]|uniref:Uncharacterized protein n=1 Tax=Smallanthus sonchifolius TaxID=185202 RepID=A0ACB9BTQ8_9ASTR|nr:hypothetical protein L1987_65184 [Smallanthus sonchifolius]
MELLSNLKTVYVSFCDGMEEVVSNRDDEEMTASASVNTNTTFFPNLDILQLEYMDNLKHIGGGIAKGTANVIHGESECSQVGDVSWSLCQYSKEISISDCKALSSVIPSYTAGRMEKLQVLSIYNCTSMMEVFETKETNINGSSTSTTLTIPRPTNSIMHKLPNLKQLTIYDCDCLEYIFTFSTLESLRNLRTLQIINCKAMKMIVREEYGTTSSKDVVFPRLKSIELNTLPSLEGFFLGVNTDFRWPLLEYARIRDCPQIITFTSGQSTAPKLKYVHTELGKHNPECGFNVMPRLHETTSPSLDGISLHPTILQGRTWSFHNLIEYNLDHNYRYTKIFPSSELQHLQKLETIHADGCQNVEEVFEVAMEVTSNESQTVFKFPKLREVDLEDMWNLKRIWKSNQGRILEFPNLTRLSIIGCHELEHVFTCSMVGCVMQLQELHIEECRNMKVIVKEEEDYDFKAIEIKFPCLKSLKLDDLECIKGFYLGEDDFTFPTLDTLVIKQCREITVFTKGLSSTPKLSVVETGFGSFDVGENINSFIITKKQVNVFSFYY